MSDTPRTNAIMAGPDYDSMDNSGVREYKLAELSRQLERELAEKEAALAGCINEMQDVAKRLASVNTERSSIYNQINSFIGTISIRTKRDAEILRAAKVVSDKWEQGIVPSLKEFKALCQAVRASESK